MLTSVRRTALLALAMGLGTTATAQVVPDARVVPGGALRVSLSPHYADWFEIFGPDGNGVLLGAPFSTDSLGAGLLSTAGGARDGVRLLTGDSTYRLNAGALAMDLDADIRFIPLRVQLGLTRWLTFSAALPIVSTNMRVGLVLDSADANAGINPGADSVALQVAAELDAAAQDLSGRIALGDFGCPGSAQCAEAQALLARAQRARDGVSLLYGIGNAVRPALVPLETSAQAAAIRAELDAVSSELAALGAPALSSTVLPFADAAADSAALNAMLGDDAYGYAARPLETTKITRRLGDLELGLRIGLLQGRTIRAVLRSTVRLPTATRDRLDDFLDLPAGDRQLDVEIGLETALEPGVVGLWLGGSYNLQLEDEVTLRLPPPGGGLPLAADAATLRRDLGDELWVAAYPSVRLTDRFRVFAMASYYRKQADRYPGTPSLETGVISERTSYGGGIWYRAEANRSGPTLPIEAGLVYRTAFSGSGAAVPRTSEVEFTLRLFYRLWGNAGAAGPPREP